MLLTHESTTLKIPAVPAKIIDEFTNLPLPGWRKFQLRRRRDHRCVMCGAPALTGATCLKHLVALRERTRRLKGSKWRRPSLSYTLEGKVPSPQKPRAPKPPPKPSRRIEDEFTHLNVSKQRKYQLRKKRDRRCEICGAPAIAAGRCLDHMIDARERLRKKKGNRRRYRSLSYRLQLAARQSAKR